MKPTKRTICNGACVTLFESATHFMGVVWGLGGALYGSDALGIEILSLCGLTFEGTAKYVGYGMLGNAFYCKFERCQ